MLKYITALTQANLFEKLEKLFFTLFLFSVPLQTKIFIRAQETYLNGQYNEYATFFLYLSDVFFIATLLFFFVNILTKRNKISLIYSSLLSFPHLILISVALIFLLFIFWGIFSSPFPTAVLLKNIKMIELLLLFFYLAVRLPFFGIINFLSVLSVSGTLQSIIGIIQYTTQGSLRLKLLGESNLGPSLAGVAKIVVDGERIVRSYGTLPHPNIFSGFLILTILSSFLLFLLFRSAEKIASRVQSEATMPEKVFNLKQNNQIVSCLPSIAFMSSKILAYLKGKKAIVSRETILPVAKEGETILNILNFYLPYLLTFGIILQITALILTFSRSAWAAFLLAILLIWLGVYKLLHAHPANLVCSLKNFFSLKEKKTIVSRETILLERYGVKQFIFNSLTKTKKYLLVVILIFISGTVFFHWDKIVSRSSDSDSNYQQSIDYRILYNNIAIEMIKQHPLSGIGNGLFTLKMKNYSPVKLKPWQFQPAHNIYLLIASEIGFIGLSLFLLIIILVVCGSFTKIRLQNVSRETFLPMAKESETCLKLFKFANKNALHPSLEATSSKKVFNLSLKEQIVSRETFLPIVKEDEAILNNSDVSRMLLFRIIMLSVFVSYLFIGLFDHYFWTLQSGQLIFWLTVGALFSYNK